MFSLIFPVQFGAIGQDACMFLAELQASLGISEDCPPRQGRDHAVPNGATSSKYCLNPELETVEKLKVSITRILFWGLVYIMGARGILE